MAEQRTMVPRLRRVWWKHSYVRKMVNAYEHPIKEYDAVLDFVALFKDDAGPYPITDTFKVAAWKGASGDGLAFHSYCSRIITYVEP